MTASPPLHWLARRTAGGAPFGTSLYDLLGGRGVAGEQDYEGSNHGGQVPPGHALDF